MAIAFFLLAATAAGSALAAEETYLKYEVEIAAPGSLAKLLRAELDLVRWQGHETMTPELLDRLVAEARTEAANLLAAQGYFSPRIESRIEGSGVERTVHLDVDPGPATRVSAVNLRFSGPIAQGDAEDRSAIALAESEWKLAKGEVFTQAGWEDAKRSVRDSVSKKRYLLARIAESEARIDPASRSAELTLTIESGPAVSFGELEITGLEKRDPAVVRNLRTFAPGMAYDRELLERYQRRLTTVEYFDSVLIDADPASVAGDRVPVRVTLHEAPAKRLQLGASFSTDTGLGGSISYQDRSFFNPDWRLGLRLDLEQKIQTGLATIAFPERAGPWADQLALRLRHSDIENLDTREASLGFRRTAIEERRQPFYGVTLALSKETASGVLDETVYATYGYVGFTRRTTDNLLSPRRGTVAQIEGGIAPPGVSSRAFGRTVGRVAWYYPLRADRDLLLQAQAGAVFANSSEGIPQQFLFRTGGSTTVRGYDLDSLGVARGNAIVGGRVFATATAEATQWINDQLGVAAFIDVGNAADRVGDLRAAVGIGVGARLRTPLGPLRADIAYGELQQQWRLHFSIGLSF